jgi:hypothetical protein
VGTGRLVSSEKKKDFLETEWVSEIPYSFSGFNYGEFVARSQGDADLTVRAYDRREMPADARSVAEGSYEALRFMEDYFGPLPFKTVSLNERPGFGYGQTWPTLIFLPYRSSLGETTGYFRLDRTGLRDDFFNIVAFQELAHEWWGHLVGWKTYHDYWLTESIADFSASLWLKKFDPKRFKGFWDLNRVWLYWKTLEGHRPVDVGPLWLANQLPAYREADLYQILVYCKGAYVLEMLRTMMEDPTLPESDTRFMDMMRDFASTYAGKNASTEDFRRVVEKHIGQPMDWFFEQWVYGTEVPRLEFSYQLKEGPAGKTVAQIMLKQSKVSDSFVTLVPFYSHLKDQLQRLGLLKVKGSSTYTGEVTLPFRPDKIILDEYHSVLCKPAKPSHSPQGRAGSAPKSGGSR